MDPLAGKGDPGWLTTAVREISQIREQLSLTSDRAFSKAIHMNPRTVAKLNPEHPNASIQYETVCHMFCQIGLYLEKDEKSQPEEYQLVFKALLRVYRSYKSRKKEQVRLSHRKEGKNLQNPGKED